MAQIELVKHYDFLIYPQDVDADMNLRLVALEGYLLNTAGLAAQQSGFGSVGMMQRGITWVLSRLAVEMTALPAQYETLTVETWVEDYGRLFTTRNFRLYNQQGVHIGSACSLWALIDMNTRRPVSLQQYPEFTCFATGRPADIEKPERLPDVSTNEAAAMHKVVYSDIDFNGHVNSTKYAEWMFDALPADFAKTRMPSRFAINYMHEARIGEMVSVRYQQQPSHTLFELCSSEGECLCKGCCTWPKD